MKILKKNFYKEFSILFWIAFITIISAISFTIYSSDQNEKKQKIQSTLDNIYLKKSIKEFTTNLKPRYTSVNYTSKAGDTHESIINKLKITKEEKKKILKLIIKEKALKVLKINQKYTFKFDNLSSEKITEFRIETDKKNEVLFKKLINKNEFVSKQIKKNFTKNLVYKENLITNSLYNSALNTGIKPNVIIEFARLYGFQVDFQRDIWKDDSFQIIY